MHYLDIATILICTIMLGNELALSLFINPAIWRYQDSALAAELARTLGKVMPFWYALGQILLVVEAWLRHRQPDGSLLLGATILWAVAIFLSVFFLVPRNKRIAKAPADWEPIHRQWDRIHRARITLLLTSSICLILALC